MDAIHVCTENPVHNAYSYETKYVKVGMKRAIELLKLNSVWQYLTKRQSNLLLVLKTYIDQSFLVIYYLFWGWKIFVLISESKQTRSLSVSSAFLTQTYDDVDDTDDLSHAAPHLQDDLQKLDRRRPHLVLHHLWVELHLPKVRC